MLTAYTSFLVVADMHLSNFTVFGTRMIYYVQQMPYYKVSINPLRELLEILNTTGISVFNNFRQLHFQDNLRYHENYRVTIRQTEKQQFKRK